MNRDAFARGLSSTLSDATIAGLGALSRGKVRDSYVAKGVRVLVTTDRLSAFDRVITTLPFKGQVLNRLAAFWFERTQDDVPNHVLDVVDPNVLVARDCAPLPVEFVMRAYLTGVTDTSVYTHYARGERVYCGHRLPDGLRKNDPLPDAILTPTTKAEHGGHDAPVSREEVLATGVVTARDFDEAAAYAHTLFARGTTFAKERGLVLADTKYEFGKTADGRIVVIDEMHTPDSSRYWLAETYAERHARHEEPESFDKEIVRRFLKSIGYAGEGDVPELPDDVRIDAAMKYASAFERIAGEPFVPDETGPIARITANLQRKGLL